MMEEVMHVQKKYLDDYQRDGQGSWVYTGPAFVLRLKGKELRTAKWICALFVSAGWILFLTMGLLDSASSRVLYVALPYVGALMPLMLLVGDVYKLAVAPQKMTRREYDKSVVQMRHASLAAAALAAACALGSAVFLLLGKAGELAGREAVFLGLSLACTALMAGFARYQAKFALCGQENQGETDPISILTKM